MEKRFLVVLAVAAVAVVVVGLSAAATASRGDSQQPARSVQPEKDTNKAQTAKKPASKTQQQASSPAVASSGRSQSSKDVESYWTKERMDDAQPMEKTRQGGSPSSSPRPSGTMAPGSAPTKQPTPQKSRAKKSQSANGVVTSPAATPNPGYWTDDAMAGAQPMDKTRPGGSGSQDSPDSGGTFAPGSPPS